MPISILENEIPRVGPVGVTEPDGNRTVRRIKVAYGHLPLYEIKRRLLGYTVYEVDGTLTRYLPWKDPIEPFQYAVRVDHQAVGYQDRDESENPDIGMTTTLAPIDWHASIHFANLPYPIGDGEHSTVPGEEDYIVGVTPPDETSRYCTKTINPGREFFNPPVGTLYIGGQSLSVPLPIMLPYSDIEVTWYQIPTSFETGLSAYPITAIEQCLGRVNDNILSLPALPDGKVQYAAQTLNLYSIRPQLIYQSDGSYAVNVTYGFRYRGGVDRDNGEINWNKAPDATNKWYPLTRDAAGTLPFLDTANFDNLFLTELLYTP